MPTTIEQAATLVVTAGLALVGWIAVLAGTTLAVQPETLLAIGPAPALHAGVAASDAAFVAEGLHSLTLRPQRPDTAMRLYAEGAWLVLPAPGTGCFGRR